MVNGNFSIEPNTKQLLEYLNLILDNKISRETVANYADQYILEDIPSIDDKKTWELITILSGIDTKITETEYLYSNEDIKDWIKKFE